MIMIIGKGTHHRGCTNIIAMNTDVALFNIKVYMATSSSSKNTLLCYYTHFCH